MKGGITGGAGGSAVTPFMLHNLTKSLNEGKEVGRNGGAVGRRERAVEQERERERVQLRQREEQLRSEAERERREGVVVCKERAGGVQWKYVTKEGRAGEKAMQVMHAKQHRDPVAVGYFFRAGLMKCRWSDLIFLENSCLFSGLDSMI